MARYTTEDPNDLIQQIKELTKRVENLETGNRIGSTSIDSGTFFVNSGTMAVGKNPQIVYFGPIAFGGDPAAGWIFRRADNTGVFALLGTSPSDQFWALYDNQGNIIVSDDGASDQGLARPYIPLNFVAHSNFVPDLTTTSGTFTPVQTGLFYKQHPKVVVSVLVRASDGSTSGEVQLYDATHSQVVAGPTTIGLGAYTAVNFGPAAVTGTFSESVTLEVQIRRTAGAGTIGARVFVAYGVQS